MFRGTLKSATNLYNHVDTDLWVVDRRTHIWALPTISLYYEEKLKSIEGIEQVYPITIHPETILFEGKRLKQEKIDIVGYYPDTGLAAPWKLLQEPREGRTHETGIIISDHVAKSNGLGVGDIVSVSFPRGNIIDMEISAIALQAGSLRFDYAFVPIDVTLQTFHVPESTSFLLVRVNKDADLQEVKARLEQAHPELIAFTTPEINRYNVQYWYDVMGNPMAMVSAILILVVSAIISLSVYSLIIRKKREFGILLAVGTREGQLRTVVLVQTFFLGISTFIVGYLIHLLFFLVFKLTVPKMRLEISAFTMLTALIGIIAICLVSALLPLSKLKRIDPMEVFRQ
jgi:ABC-type lipoprotein release transport system permease subunit